MTALWDTSGTDVVRQLAAARRSGGLTSGLALTLVVVADERPGTRNPPVAGVEDAVTVAAAAHPCRLLVVTRSAAAGAADRLDAEVVVGGRLGPCEAVIMRMQGRLALHAESVVAPLLAPDVPVVTWWYGPPPERIATDPLGVAADRRITDCALAPDPIAALTQRAVDYAPGDTDLAWTRTTGWRTLLAGALEPMPEPPVAVSITAGAGDPSAALLSGWLAVRLGLTPERVDTAPGDPLAEVRLDLTADSHTADSHTADTDAADTDSADPDRDHVRICRHRTGAVLHRPGQEKRKLPLLTRSLGDELAEELRQLHPDRPYADALGAATGVADLADRRASRIHAWLDPAEA